MALILSAALIAPGPLFAASVENSFHADSLLQPILIEQSPADINSGVSLSNGNSLEGGKVGDEIPALEIQSSKSPAPEKQFSKTPSFVKERITLSAKKAPPLQKSAAKISGFVQGMTKTIAVKRGHLAKALSNIFDYSNVSNALKNPAIIGTQAKQGKSFLSPWHKAGALLGAATPLAAGVELAAADAPPAPKNGSSYYNAIQPGLFGSSNLTHLVMLAVTIGVGYYFWKKYGKKYFQEKRQKYQNWQTQRSASWKASSERQKTENTPPKKITFADVAGQDEAVAKMKDIADAFLDPSEYKKIDENYEPESAVLLIGPPGTGKTLLARATRNELGIDAENYFEATGGSFGVKFVGEGQDEVTKFFGKAREQSRKTGKPAMLFIDELDGFGRRSGNDNAREDEKTINALLTQMNDLTGPDYKIFVVGATNEFGKLDEAITRIGRFGAHITLEKPDAKAREAILKLHTKKTQLDPDVDLHAIAEKIQGFSGADIGDKGGLVKTMVRIARKRLAKSVSGEDAEKAVQMIKDGLKEKAAAVKSSNKKKLLNLHFEDPEDIKTTLADIEGQDEAKAEVEGLINQTKNQSKYLEINPQFRPIRGALFYGPHGTGKTLIARAVAKESRALFLSVNASEILKSLQGQSEEAVREIFETAAYKSKLEKKHVIIFFDEIDAIARARGSSINGNTDGIVNQLLTSIDGFSTENNITVIAATNRPEMLDPALTRGGRLELQIPIGKPDVVGREKILQVHAKTLSMDANVNLREIAEQTAGFAGADLESLVMKATTAALERGEKSVSQEDFIKAIERVQLGMERKLAISDEEKQTTAYHETGHALVSHLLPDADPISKVTIVPHGLGNLGLMNIKQGIERYTQNRSWLIARLAVGLGGRVGEELMNERINGKKDMSSGAGGDIQVVSDMAREMVAKLGMSEKIGPISYGAANEPSAPRSEKVKEAIDDEVAKLVHDAHILARQTIESHWDIFKAIAEELKKKETLRGEDFDRLIPKAQNLKK